MLKTYSLGDLTPDLLEKLLQRPRMDYEVIFERVEPIIKAVKSDGDKAVLRFTKEFDGVSAKSLMYEVRPEEEIPLETEIKDAFRTAYSNIHRFHQVQWPQTLTVETMPGVVCSRTPRAIKRVGLYIPGGTAILPSSVLMLGVPAQIAGCKTVILATPPRSDGTISPEVEFAASLCQIKHVLLAGGAQAVAALAYGTETIPKVDKILGPGNQYVTAAKMLLQNSDAMVSIDMPAGPSEVLVIADEAANPAFVAADLLSQAEHGVDSQVVLVTLPGFNTDELQKEIASQCAALPRSETASKALENSFIIIADDIHEAVDFTNEYAPEHLIINTADADNVVDLITTAGSVFVGPWTPESVGDYASGTNHTLPTYGFARMYSGVSIDSFIRQMTVQKLSAEGLSIIGPVVEVMARTEGLAAHERAVSIRLKTINSEES